MLLLSYKINSKYTGIMLLDEYSHEIWRNEAATLWTKAYWGLNSFKIPWGYFYIKYLYEFIRNRFKYQFCQEYSSAPCRSFICFKVGRQVTMKYF
jgi:hypothetical protein